jgi:hypothetical protein
MLVETILAGAILTDCRIYGIAAWNVELKGTSQNNLVITRDGEPTITVDNLEVAQFIYLLLNNSKIRDCLLFNPLRWCIGCIFCKLLFLLASAQIEIV